jgi:hypothetical protein
MPTIAITRCLAAPFVLLALVGCGEDTIPRDDLPRESVSGAVTLDGQPMARGTIQFDPVQGTQGPAAFAVGEIKDGKFAIDRARGPVPGQYKVSISSRPPIVIAPDQGPGERPKQEPEKVPVRYNKKSTLTKEITGGATNAFDFELKSS